MKRLVLTLSTLLISTPVQAITWREFWEPFTHNDSHHHYHYHHEMCTERIVREQYVPGNRWRSGFVRTWTEWITIPCHERRYYPQ
jgi:hypothetical protein